MLAFSDKDHALHVIDVASGKVSDVDKDDYGDITDYRWSPDSRWLTYTKDNDVQFSSIYVYNLGDGKAYRLTSGLTNDTDPVFDPKGRYLYFTSNRDFNLTFSDWEFNYVYTDSTRVYVGVLSEDGPALFLPQSDEEKSAAAADASATPAATPAPAKTDAAKPDVAKKPNVVVKIDPATFERRVRAIPGPGGTYGNLNALPNGILYVKTEGDAQSLRFYNIEDRKEETVLEELRGYDLSANGEKIIVSLARNNYAIVNPKGGQKTAEAILRLDSMQMKVDPKAEWTQEFNDAWRILRDWFYDPNMHGNDWNAIRAQYAQLLPYVAHRADLDYILGEIAGEMNSGHVYVGSPNDVNTPRVENGLLGAEIVPDSGYFRIKHIFPGENWHEAYRSPLTEPGVKVREGDYILAIDGVSTKGVDNFYRLLENKADRVVTLLVNGSASTAGAREEKVRPVKRETNLRYLDWVASRRAYVDKASGGRIGYMHLPNTGGEGNRELVKAFYPQASKDALIIDDRYNGGGFIPDRMIELLDRPVLNYWARRNVKPNATPGFAHIGPK
ncbi:MAG TPA: PDZ domain-containing protein, partial [Thermoanaerobaculia bacterium]